MLNRRRPVRAAAVGLSPWVTHPVRPGAVVGRDDSLFAMLAGSPPPAIASWASEKEVS